jgi:hypothetical protein
MYICKIGVCEKKYNYLLTNLIDVPERHSRKPSIMTVDR